MSSQQPFNQLTGVLQVYLAPYGTAVPAVTGAPSGSWVLLGPTDGEQVAEHKGALTFFRDNDNQGPVKSVRPEEDFTITYTVVGLSMTNLAKIWSAAANLTTNSNVQTLGLERGFLPTEYALIFRGETVSPAGAYPAQYVLPRCVFDGEPQATFAKDGRPGLECIVTALVDPAQSTGLKMGWLVAQVS